MAQLQASEISDPHITYGNWVAKLFEDSFCLVMLCASSIPRLSRTLWTTVLSYHELKARKTVSCVVNAALLTPGQLAWTVELMSEIVSRMYWPLLTNKGV